MSRGNESAAPASRGAGGLDLDARYIVRLAGTLLAICVAAALLLGIANYFTQPVIERMEEEKTAEAMSQVLPAQTYEPVEPDADAAEGVKAVYRAADGDAALGYVVQVETSGFGGAISMVVGVDLEGRVTGVTVTSHGETPNVGSKVVNDQAVLDRFVGMSRKDGEITVNSGENRFDGVSGATVSSRGVAAGVNTALAAVAGLS